MNTPDTYAVSILLDRSGLLEVPLHVDFWPDPSQEVTYVRFASTKDAWRKDESFIGSIPVYHPAGTVLDESNWAGFLYLMLRSKDKMQIEYKTDVRGCYKISSEMSFGYYYFQVDSVNGLFGIIVDRPKGTPRLTRGIKHATVIKSPFESLNRLPVGYDDEGIFLRKSLGVSRSPNHDIYWTRFKERLSHKQILNIYIDGIDTLSLSPDMFYPAADEWDLEFHSIDGFEFFQSLDKKVLFTLQKNPIQKAFKALYKSANPTTRDFNQLILKYAINGDDPRVVIDILEECVNLLTVTLTS